ncbi:MAG TPA: Holliday junction resolvase RuvX [Roseiflexaceae bacterium]|nr:Holliday junction resolvase RuvX [Roseiflexaceae bacterium]
MALDIGGRRIGVAVSDPTRTLASPLTTLHAQPRSTVFSRIRRLLEEQEATALVVGLPVSLNGAIGPQAREVQQFVEELRPLIEIPIHFVDERLTSVAADRMMSELGIRPEKRKERIDQVAASLILQDFLDADGRNRRE